MTEEHSASGRDALVVGRLTGYGPARYQFRSDADASYFVRVLTDRGERVLWGKDLERALRVAETSPKIGDLIGARRVGRDAVTLTDVKRAPDGRVLTKREHRAHRAQWLVEKVTFFAERAKLARLVRDAHLDARESVREHPELKSTFLSLRGAEELAARRIANPADRARFLTLVREAIAGSIRSGEPLPAVQLRTQATKDRASKARAQKDRDDGPAR